MARNLKIILALLVIIVIAGAVYAFAAANTVPDSAAGYRASVVPGYTVSNIIYDLDAADPTVIDAITFDIAPTSGTAAAVTVMIQTANAGTWTTCTVAAGAATCTFGSLNVIDVTALNIVATSSTNP